LNSQGCGASYSLAALFIIQTLRPYRQLGLFGFDFRSSKGLLISISTLYISCYDNQAAGKLALFFQNDKEFPSAEGFHICHSHGGGNPYAVR
jgi:hypothetical protein